MSSRGCTRWSLALVVAVLAFATHAQEREYELRYELTLVPAEDRAEVAITLGDGARFLREARFHIDPKRYSAFTGDGEITTEGEYVTWDPPKAGGTLRYQVRVTHERDDGEFDAMMTEDWALFRGDDVFPPAAVRITAGAEADATLHVDLPADWSFRAPYRRMKGDQWQIVADHRSFDRPVGWMVAGRIGVRLEQIEDIRVAVAGPMDHGIRRMDILAFLNWNLPWIKSLLPDMPGRLLVVSAGDPMWRGGLSGPRSLYIHADRPLLSANGTSTLMHELMHVATGLDSGPKADWIVEGLAEYYSVELMRRSGTLTDRRFERAIDSLVEWGGSAKSLARRHSTGAVTARAVSIMRDLDQEIRRRTKSKASLDDVLRRLVESAQDVDLALLRTVANEVAGAQVKALAPDQLPGIEE